MIKTLSKVLLTIMLGVAIGFFTSCSTTNYTTQGLNNYKNKGKYSGIVRVVTTDGKFFCSAVIISNREAVSAAHCFMGLTENEFIIESIPNEKNQVISAPSFVVGINPRADVALIYGDFTDFDNYQLETNPESDILVNNYELITCGFPYGGKLVCYKFTNPTKMVDVIAGIGQMYAGMSGGPVIDLKTGKILAVNHAIGQGIVLIAPLTNFYPGLKRIR